MAGVSRSATVVIAWLMQKHKLSFDEAFRRCNYGFCLKASLCHCVPVGSLVVGYWRVWQNVVETS
eukprot:1157436-Pelagomonas_calceolata.AAC.4